MFVLDSKHLQGTVIAERDHLSLTRPGETGSAYTSDNFARKARAQGVELNRLLRQRGSLSPWVTAVVVLWAEFPQRATNGHNMSYVHGDQLLDWLLSRPARLNALQIDQIAESLRPGQRRFAKGGHAAELPPATTIVSS